MRARLLGVVGACSALLATGAASPAPAPLLYLSPAGSDSGRCTKAAPCESFARAYRVARPGQTVVVGGGRYGGQQEVEKDAAKTSSRDVLFRPAPKARVVVESLDVYGSHVEFRGIRIEEDFYVKCGADDVTLRSSKATLFFIRSATNIRILGTEFGPSDHISQIGHTAECPRSPRGIVLDRVYMHDFTNPNPDKHMECLTVQAASDFVIRRSRFHHCEDFNILLKHRSPVLETTNMTIENSWFDKPWPDGTSAIQFSEPDGGGTFTNVLIRNNSFAGTLTIKPEIEFRNLRVIANAGSKYGGRCGNGITSYNVWRSGACGGTDRQADPRFLNERGFDFHLAPGSPAINRGHPKSFPRVDIDGQRRPVGRRSDAGADEFRRR
jgi:hypothetical protein